MLAFVLVAVAFVAGPATAQSRSPHVEARTASGVFGRSATRESRPKAVNAKDALLPVSWNRRDVSATEAVARALKGDVAGSTRPLTSVPPKFRSAISIMSGGQAIPTFDPQDRIRFYQQNLALRKSLGEHIAVVKPLGGGYLVGTLQGAQWGTQPEVTKLLSDQVRESGARVAVVGTPEEDITKLVDAVRARSGAHYKTFHLELPPPNRPVIAQQEKLLVTHTEAEALVSIDYGAQMSSIFDFKIARPKSVLMAAWDRFVGKLQLRLTSFLDGLKKSNSPAAGSRNEFRAPSIAALVEDEIRKVAAEEGIPLETIKASVRVGTTDLHISLEIRRAILEWRG